MNATSSHDTKRSEDVRARIAALSEMPDRWAERLDRWRAMNVSKAEMVDGVRAPSVAREISLYQTLLGAWPLVPTELPAFRGRIAAYLPKAIREAKIRSHWEEPNTPYEEAVVRFALRLLEGAERGAAGGDPFLGDFLPFLEEVAFHGLLGSLAQTTLKLCAPGVPDVYQGCETWCFSLVDPDNRRPVDYARLEAFLEDPPRTGEAAADAPASASGGAGDPAALVDTWKDGRLKLFVTRRLLELRRAMPDLFERGEYLPLEVRGPAARHAIAFARRLGEDFIVVVVPLRTLPLLSSVAAWPIAPRSILDPGPWGDTHVVAPAPAAGGRWTPVLEGSLGHDGERLRPGFLPAAYRSGSGFATGFQRPGAPPRRE